MMIPPRALRSAPVNLCAQIISIGAGENDLGRWWKLLHVRKRTVTFHGPNGALSVPRKAATFVDLGPGRYPAGEFFAPRPLSRSPRGDGGRPRRRRTAVRALAVPATLSRLRPNGDDLGSVPSSLLRYGTALMLAIGYAASIGGIATPIGTPPNLMAVSLLDTTAGVKIPFFTWMLLATPITVAMLAVLTTLLRARGA